MTFYCPSCKITLTLTFKPRCCLWCGRIGLEDRSHWVKLSSLQEAHNELTKEDRT